jgi:hypothetical protein
VLNLFVGDIDQSVRSAASAEMPCVSDQVMFGIGAEWFDLRRAH